MNNDTLPWNAVLRKFIDKATDVVLDGSRKKRNRRTGLLAPGIIKEPKLKIGVAMDTSGSVSDDFISAFLGELDKIYGTGITDIRVTFGDTVPNDVVQYKPRTKMNMSGRGGTLFQPFLDKLNDEDVDVIVYFTDGDNYDTIQTKIPVLWCLCPNYSIPKGAKERDCVKMKLG
jgi:predicted metal-dependent peptidase